MIELLRVDELKLPEDRVHSSIELMVESIQKQGFLDAHPLTVNKDLTIIDGQVRYLAAKRVGLKLIPCRRI